MFQGRISALILVGGLVAIASTDENPAAPSVASASPNQAAFQQFVESHCLGCHDNVTKTSDLALDHLMSADLRQNQEPWEKVVRKLTTRQMPPSDAPRPEEAEYDAAIAWLESSLDAAAAERPNPGRTETFRRLNRTEYQNVIRDLLALEIDAAALLPADESSHGFDNITVTDLSPTLLTRYITAAQTISHLAVGRAPLEPREDVFRIRPDVTQDSHVEGLPLGTRGGAVFAYNFPQDGEYEIRVRLMRDRNDEVESLTEPHELEVLLDRERVAQFTVKPPRGDVTHDDVDEHLKARIKATAGPHDVGVAFPAKGSSLLETARQPLNVHFNFYRHPRLGPAVYQVSIIGPLESSGPGDTPSRRRLFGTAPAESRDEAESARRILSDVMRRAYRRPINDEDLKTPMEFYRAARAEGDFDAGIEMALSSILVNPNFLFRIERDPDGAESGTAYTIDDVTLASRLSFFLWSSIPDDELLDLAARGELSQPEVLEQQVRRMLADKRSQVARQQFCGPVALSSQSGIGQSGYASVSRLRRQLAAGDAAGDGVVFREHCARGPQRARPDQCRLHVPQ